MTDVVPLPFQIDVPRKFQPLFQPYRYKIAKGGRGSAKSHSCARALIARAYSKKTRVLCAREFQTSIAESVHYLLDKVINDIGAQKYFDVTQNSIKSHVGSEFIFKGLRRNLSEIKSTEDIDVCWVEEAETMSVDSLNVLIPTVRNQGSELWFSYNPKEPGAPVHRMSLNPPPNSVVIETTFRDNKYFPKDLEEHRLYLQQVDPLLYAHVYEGATLVIGAAIIFHDKISVEEFEAPEGVRFFHGVDWGFANDPTVLIRSFVKDGDLWVDQEAVGHHTELTNLPALFDRIPTARLWPLKADNSRPETISYLRNAEADASRRSFNISGARKWPGSVEDGIAYLKSFKKIRIHPRCKNLIQESLLYSYKVDAITKDVLPEVVDKYNHSWDALRYSLDGYIRALGVGIIAAPFVGITPKMDPMAYRN